MDNTATLSQLRNKINDLKFKVMRDKDLIKRHEALIDEKNELENLKFQIELEENKYNKILLFSIKTLNDKKERDYALIQEAILTASELVIQNSKITPILYTPENRKFPETYVVNKIGDANIPIESNQGVGVIESISNLVNLCVLDSTNFMNLALFDEYFSSVSKENSLNISEKYNAIIDDKFQAILIEQKDEIFEKSSYRNFHIVSDGITSTIKTYDVVYENGEKTVTEVIID